MVLCRSSRPKFDGPGWKQMLYTKSGPLVPPDARGSHLFRGSCAAEPCITTKKPSAGHSRPISMSGSDPTMHLHQPLDLRDKPPKTVPHRGFLVWQSKPPFLHFKHFLFFQTSKLLFNCSNSFYAYKNANINVFYGSNWNDRRFCTKTDLSL